SARGKGGTDRNRAHSTITSYSNKLTADLFSAGCSHAASRVSAFPTDICSWSIDRRYRLIEQAQVDAQLRAMMRGVQHAPPEDPDSFAFHVEERNDREPPVFLLAGKKGQTCVRELDHTRSVTFRRTLRREDFIRRYFRQTENLAKEPAFRQELM